MHILEKYHHSGEGYNPFLIRPGWQVAQLNYAAGLALEALTHVDRHNATDEVFVLLQGTPVLVTAQEQGDTLSFQACLMQPVMTYNVPAGLWHAIAIHPGDTVLIVENAYTHRDDFEFRDLNASEYTNLVHIVHSEVARFR